MRDHRDVPDDPTEESYEQLVARIAKIVRDDGQPIKRQHVISKVVLKQFTRPTGDRTPPTMKLCRFDLARGVGREVTTGGAGYVENYVRVASRSAEALWRTVETRLDDAIAACLRGSVFDEPAHVDTIKDTLALHYARSKATKQIHEDAVHTATARSLVRIRTERLPRMREVFVEHYGREPSDDELDDIERTMRDGAEQVDSDAIFRANLPQLFEMTREFARGHALEVACPAGGEFLIGDVPVLSPPPRADSPAIPRSVGLYEASAVVMPLGPQLAVSTGDVDQLVVLAEDAVRDLNRVQVEAAISHVHFRIGSQLEDFVRSIPRPQTQD
jgi:hypothetical protein